jgi:hypothetical protein
VTKNLGIGYGIAESFVVEGRAREVRVTSTSNDNHAHVNLMFEPKTLQIGLISRDVKMRLTDFVLWSARPHAFHRNLEGRVRIGGSCDLDWA